MAPVFTPPPTGMQPSASSASGGAAATAASGGGPSTEDELAKLREDLGTVAEKIALCREMLPHSPVHVQRQVARCVFRVLLAGLRRVNRVTVKYAHD